MTVSGAALASKFRGALLGVAVGDALGAPFEGMPRVPIDAVGRLAHDPGPLRYTDDTHMTLGLAESLVACGGFDGHHLASTFAHNFAAEPWRGYGAGPPQVFRLLAEGVPWHQAGRRLFNGAGSYGNGAAMRVVPVALLAYDDLEQVAWLARQTAVITHAHELGVEGAVLQACAVALLLQQAAGVPLAVPAFLETLRGLVGSPLFCQRLDMLPELLPGGSLADAAHRLGHGVAAQEAVPAALYAFLRYRDDFAAVVTGAITLGGDTDTIASMAGALAGAFLGEDSIPGQWSNEVEGAAQLWAHADALHMLRDSGEWPAVGSLVSAPNRNES